MSLEFKESRQKANLCLDTNTTHPDCTSCAYHIHPLPRHPQTVKNRSLTKEG